MFALIIFIEKYLSQILKKVLNQIELEILLMYNVYLINTISEAEGINRPQNTTKFYNLDSSIQSGLILTIFVVLVQSFDLKFSN